MSTQDDYNEQVVLRWAEARMRELGTWPDAAAVAPPPASPEPMPEGWTMTYPGYAERSHRGISVDSDADGITTEESVTGYGGYKSTVWVPMAVLRALLATQGLHIVKK